LREKKMRRFKSVRQAQRFLSAFGRIYEYFKPRRHHLSAEDYHAILQDRFLVWNEITAAQVVA
jgi:putative transposase